MNLINAQQGDTIIAEDSPDIAMPIEENWELLNNVSFGDPLVLELWSSAHKYTKISRFDKWISDCIQEYNNSKELLAPFLVMTSIKSNTYFINKYIYYEISEYPSFHDIQKMNCLYEDYLEVVNNYDIYRSAVNSVLESMMPELKLSLECPSNWHCGCLSSLDVQDFKEELTALKEYDSDINTLVIFINYIDPVLRIFIVSIGFTLNMKIIKMFITHKQFRTESNIIIFNLLFNDVLYTIVYVPLQYVHYYYYELLPHKHFTYNGVYIFIESSLFSSSAFSILALYFQRYFSTLSIRKPSDKRLFVLYITTVWTLSFIISTIVFLLNHYQVGGLEINSVSTVYLGLLKGLPFTMFVLNKLTKRKLKKMDEDHQVDIEEFISSKLIKTLCFVYWLTHTPLFMWLCVEKGVGLLSLYLRFNYVFIELCLYYLLFLYPILNVTLIVYLCSDIKKHCTFCSKRLVSETDMGGTESFQGTVDTTIM